MATIQVVAVGQRTGQRFPILAPHENFKSALFHRTNCALTFTDETYEIDILLADGTWRQNITGEDLGYPASEIDSVIQGATDFVARRQA